MVLHQILLGRIKLILAQVLSAAMMLRYGLNQPTAALRIEQVVLQVLDLGVRTGDIMSEGMNQVG
jgi:3-isopropylmalate dehydrogenase